MKNVLLCFSLIAICSCTAKLEKIDIEKEKANVLAVDSEFSAMSENKGMAVAFLYYADSNVVELNNGEHPVQGISAMADRFRTADNSQFRINWKPLKCEIAQSADLAYTFGDWTIHQATANGADSVSYGNYVSIWKKQGDGNWRYVLDAGTSTPGPTVVTGKQ